MSKDITIPSSIPSLLLDKHSTFLHSYDSKRLRDDLEFCMTEYLRMSGVYWTVTAMDILGGLDKMNKCDIIGFIKDCVDEDSGGIRPAPGHDAHLLYTLSAVQVLILYDALEEINVEGVVKFVVGLQQEDGSFAGDKWGECDTRLSFCAVACLSLLKRLDAIDVGAVVKYVVSCKNFDGGFGSKPGSESHAGLIYCCVALLSITDNLHELDADLLGWWLCERQLPSGGLNGRPEKLPDVCYSWWVLSSLSILGRLSWIDKDALCKFILASQDNEIGGFSDRPGDMVDPFHTLFGLAGISLLGENRLKPINPVFCLPQYVIDRVGVTTNTLNL